MADDVSKHRSDDGSRIDTRESWDPSYWAGQLGVSEEDLRAAVIAVGTHADDVRTHLTKAGRNK